MLYPLLLTTEKHTAAFSRIASAEYDKDDIRAVQG